MLSNFYTDNAYIIKDFEVVASMQKGLGEILAEHAEQLTRNRILSQIETYRTIPVQYIPIDSATYDTSILLTNQDVVNVLGFASKTLNERISSWNLLELGADKIINALDVAGNYVELSSVAVYPFQGYPVAPSFDIVSMDLYSGEDRLQIGVDFEIRKNKLYLLNEIYGNRIMNQKKIFLARDIAIDYDTAYRNYGANINLPKYPDLSKDIYNDILQKLVMSVLNGPTIANLKSGIAAITNASTENSICDMYSASSIRQHMWQTTLALTPLDFLIELPAEFSVSDTLSDIVKRYMDAVKPADADYKIMLHTIYDELYSRHVSANDTYSIDVIKCNYGAENYSHRTVSAQINNPERELNIDFTTEYVHGYATREYCQTKITHTDTGQVEVVEY